MSITDAEKAEGTPLLDTHKYDHIPPFHQDNKIWQFFHAFFFLLGGTCFIIGTSLYYFPDLPQGGMLAAVFYIVGSCGFLGVDTQEFLTFTQETFWIGSLLYVIGSAGFLPDVYTATDGVLGIQGFIWGSFFIGCSQFWKTSRIGSDESGIFSLGTLFKTTDSTTACGVEFNAGLGAWCFFFGTLMYWHGPQEGPFYILIVCIWLLGSLFFTAGGCFLAWRHINNL